MKLLALAIRNLFRNRRRTILTSLSVAASLFVFSVLMSLPGVGMILAATMALEIGDIGRFLSAERLASYSGTTPRVHASGGKVRFGELRVDVNRYLKWAFAEAANPVALHHRRRPKRHVSQLYRRLRLHKGHAKAIGAVARHLAEAAFRTIPCPKSGRRDDWVRPEPERCLDSAFRDDM